jgi:8-oxo-dGTP pyrophosphatase MutT (NUDIX family)
MDPGETFEQTLRRELAEEIGVQYDGIPRQLTTVLSPLTIPVGDGRVSLVLLPYEVALPEGVESKLGADEPEEAFGWFAPKEAAKLLTIKYPTEFCEVVAHL